MSQLGEMPSPCPETRAKVRPALRDLLLRAVRYEALSRGTQVRHLQQILNAYGSDVAFHWLRRPSDATRVVTVQTGPRSSSQKKTGTETGSTTAPNAIIVHDNALSGS